MKVMSTINPIGMEVATSSCLRERYASRIAGSLIGLAVGDALGAPVEGKDGEEVIAILGSSEHSSIDWWDSNAVDRHSMKQNQLHQLSDDENECEDDATSGSDKEDLSQSGDKAHHGLDKDTKENTLRWRFMDNPYGPTGIYTDDTQFALCSIQSILEVSSFSFLLLLNKCVCAFSAFDQ